MRRLQRVRYAFGGLLMLLAALVLPLIPEIGIRVIGLIVSITLLLSGMGSLIYYFTMARHMVGGRAVLFRGVIFLDLGMFAFTLAEIPTIYILLYVLIGHLFSGVVSVLRSLEARKLEGRNWKLNLAYGIANILLAAACCLCFRSKSLLVIVYAVGLGYAACLRIVSAFRRTAIVYIP